jgi:hypothetical protein
MEPWTVCHVKLTKDGRGEDMGDSTEKSDIEKSNLKCFSEILD